MSHSGRLAPIAHFRVAYFAGLDRRRRAQWEASVEIGEGMDGPSL
jgi:hypothetical protein